jgi:enamine deaminase RidA (YjgF/YER057c/UK114 family)
MTAVLVHEYLSASDVAARNESGWGGALGVAGFAQLPAIADPAVPVVTSRTPPLADSTAICELWRLADGEQSTVAAIQSARFGRVQYRYADSLLFGALTLDERELHEREPPTRAVHGTSVLARATEIGYREIFELLRAARYPYLVRVWNYLPDINGFDAGEERYRQFNSARKFAFQSSGQATVGSVPAACALGSEPGGPLCIYFLAARGAPVAIENPRQTSAYHYPPQYGRHQPIFSRACVLPDTLGTDLFVSGTASIVGHETLHSGDAVAQTRESLANISAVLDEANRLLGVVRYSLDRLQLKVYVRRPDDLAAIAGEIARTVKGDMPIVYLRADVCRRDLLVEIEASGGAPGALPR